MQLPIQLYTVAAGFNHEHLRTGLKGIPVPHTEPLYMTTVQAILFSALDTVTIGSVEIPQPGPGEVRVATAYSCVSPGTELRCLAGEEPGSDQHPFVPGYALSGTVVAVGEGVDIPVGLPVFCAGTQKCSARRQWGGHISQAVLSATGVFPVPAGLDLQTASLSALGAIAYHGVRLSQPLPHETVVVVGLGPIGQFSARLHAVTGARVIGVDVSPGRVAALQKVGIAAIRTGANLVESVREVVSEGADVVVDCTGVPAVTAQVAELGRELGWSDTDFRGPRLLIQGSYATDFAFPYRAAFKREMTILIPRNRQSVDTRAILNLMATGKVATDGLIGATYPASEAAAGYAALQDPASGLLTVAFAWK